MNFNIKLGNLLGSNKEGKVLKVNKKVGDKVSVGEVLFDVEAGKGSSSVKSEVNGIIKAVEVKIGQTVSKETILAVIDGEKVEVKKDNSTFNYFGTLIKPVKKELESDITIIGGGPGGYVAAIHAAKLGAKVTLIEKESLGGTCLNLGCIPTKALVRSANVYSELKKCNVYGCMAENIKLDMKQVMKRKNDIVNQLVSGIKYLLNRHNVNIIKGHGELVDENTVKVKDSINDVTIKSKNIILATGSKTSKLNIPGIDLKNVIDSSIALSMEELPKKIAIIGGGVIGMEFANIFRDFGVDVSVVEYFDDCLINCDVDVRKENEKNAIKKGIKIYVSSKVEEIIEAEDGGCIVAYSKDNKRKYIYADKVLVAVGRTPYCEGLGVEKLNIELNDNKRGIKVNSKMQTSIPNIYAIGDLTNIIQLAHVASHQGVVAVDNIMGRACEMDYNTVPSAIFTTPEIAMVGLSEIEAQKKGIDILVSTFPLSANGKVLTFGETEGFIKLIQHKETKVILGGAIIGIHATDLIGEIGLAVKNKLTAKDIAETIHAHPTTAEIIHEAALELEGGAIHFVR